MTFGRPIRKNPGVTAKRRQAKRRRLVRDERANKAEARARDGAINGATLTGRCRFPICGCNAFDISDSWEGSKGFVEVSHFAKHKGMGGDPTGERSQPALLICVCNWRHKQARFSIDKGTLRVVPLTSDGANGPVAWEINLEDEWTELARESAVQVLEPLTPIGHALLHDLALMKN